MIRTILRDTGIVIGAVGLAIYVAVIVGSAIGDLFGKDWDRRKDGGS